MRGNAGTRLALCSLLVGALTGVARPAHAAGGLLTEPGSALRVEHAQIVQAFAPDWTTAWVSVRMSQSGRFALVVPVPPGTIVEPGLGEWLDALDQATAARVRPPLGAPECGATVQSSIDNTSEDPLPGTPPSAVAVVSSPSELAGFAAGEGLAFDADDEAALAATPLGSRFVAILYDLGADMVRTDPLRFSMPAAAPALSLRLLESSTGSTRITLFSIGEGRARVQGADELEKAQASVTWKALEGRSDYPDARFGLLSGKKGGAWVLEQSSSQALFEWTVLPSGAGAIIPAVRDYFEQSAKHGLNVPSTDACLSAVGNARSDGELGARVSRACPTAALAVVPGGSADCDESPQAGETASVALRCGVADDVAFALSGLQANAARLTRQSGVVGSATPPSTVTVLGSGNTVTPLLTASELDTKGCVSGNGAGGAGWGGGYEYGGAPGTGTGGTYDGYYAPVPEGPNVGVDVSCWGTSDGSSDSSCSGDSSSSSDNSDSCSGDSTDSSASNGDTCSGDSTDSSDPSGDTCGGDSTSSSGDGETCSGSSDSGGGDSCSSGSSSGSGGGDCTLGRGRPRFRLSILTLLLAAFALPLRRLGRRRRY